MRDGKEISKCQRFDSMESAVFIVRNARTNPTNLHWIKLNTSLYDVDGRKSSVGDGATDTTGGSTLQVVHRIILGISRRSEEDGTGNVHGQQQRQRQMQNRKKYGESL